MGKKVTADQDELELKHTVRKILLSFGIFCLSGILFYFGESRGANSTFELILCLPISVLGIVILLFLALVFLASGAKKNCENRLCIFYCFGGACCLLWSV